MLYNEVTKDVCRNTLNQIKEMKLQEYVNDYKFANNYSFSNDFLEIDNDYEWSEFIKFLARKIDFKREDLY